MTHQSRYDMLARILGRLYKITHQCAECIPGINATIYLTGGLIFAISHCFSLVTIVSSKGEALTTLEDFRDEVESKATIQELIAEYAK